MSRTYRKHSITEDKSLVKFINDRIAYLHRRSYHYEYYLTDAGRRAYNEAIKEWEIKYHHWSSEDKWWVYRYSIMGSRIPYYVRPPKQPREIDFKKKRVIYKDVDYDKEIKEATKEYKKYSRDGKSYDGSRNREFKKHCARDLRRFNRELSRKIIKDDDTWEDKPFPDTYLGKAHIWDYW
jgi:hypothetical protein